MTSKTSYAQSPSFNIPKVTNKFSVEFWARLDGKYISQAYYLVLSLVNSNGNFLLIIRQDSANNLYCAPFYSANGDQKLNYLDYLSTKVGWEHISCVYDGDN